MPTLAVPAPTRLVARFLVLAVLAAGLLTAFAASPSTSTAAAATKCSLAGGKDRKLGPTYTTKLTVTGTTCKVGYGLVTGWYKCRTAGGDKDGTCSKKISGFTCRETRKEAIPTQFDATVTCRKSGATVTHTYTQNT